MPRRKTLKGKTLAEVFAEEEQGTQGGKRSHAGRPRTTGHNLVYRLTPEETQQLTVIATQEGLSLYKVSALLVREAMQARQQRKDTRP